MKIPIYRALYERNMMAGVPRNVAILLGTLASVLIFGLQSFWSLPFLILIYVILKLLYQNDPYFLEILIEHIYEDDYLYP